MRLTRLIVILGTIALGITCSSTENPVESEVPGPTEVSGTLGPGGGTLTSADGFLSITVPAGALDIDTFISLSEIDPSEVDTAFGDAVPLAALMLEPEELSFNTPAQVTFRMSVPPTEDAMNRAPSQPDGPTKSEFVLAAIRAVEGARVPDQKTHYNMNPGAEKNVETVADVPGGGQISLSKAMEQLGSFGAFTTLLGPDPRVEPCVGIPTTLEVELTMPDETVIEFGETWYESDPVAVDITPQMSEGEIWNPTERTPIENSRVMLLLNVDVVPKQEGVTVFGAYLGGTVVLVDPGVTDLNLGTEPDIGELEFTMEMPTFEELVESFARPGLSVPTGMTGLKGLNVAFGTPGDPAPVGDPYERWLYVAGAAGIKCYRLVRGGTWITSVELLFTLNQMNMEGVVPVSAGSSPDIARDLFMFGNTAWISSWDPDVDEYGMIGMVCSDSVYDAVAYGGKAHSEGISFGRGYGAYFLEYNRDLGMYTWPPSPGGPLIGHLFPGDGGPIVSCIVDETTRAALIIKDGLPGQIWYHSRDDVTAEGTLLGYTGNEPKQIRGAGGFYAISNYISNTLTTFTWDGGASIQNVSSTPVGLGPEGIDVMMLQDWTPLVVSTALDGHFTLSHFSSTGAHLKSVTYDVPSTCTGPRYAVFVGTDPVVYVALSCHDSGTVEIIPINLLDLE
jgi:hypothetical protein